MTAIELDRVTVRREQVSILEDVCAAVPLGSVTAIIGPNGAGKTTLLSAILGLIPYNGRIALHGRTGGRPRVGYVPQRLDFDRGSPITVLDFMVLGSQTLPVWFGVRKANRERALQSLKRVRVDSVADRPLGRLSGGEFQRVQLALALQYDAEILLLDEPVSGVDVVGEKLFCDMLEQVQHESRLTMVMVSHDLSVVSRHATHVICLNKTVQCAGPTPQMLNNANLSAIYGPHMGLYEHHGPGEHGHGHVCEHGHSHGHSHSAGPAGSG